MALAMGNIQATFVDTYIRGITLLAATAGPCLWMGGGGPDP